MIAQKFKLNIILCDVLILESLPTEPPRPASASSKLIMRAMAASSLPGERNKEKW